MTATPCFAYDSYEEITSLPPGTKLIISGGSIKTSTGPQSDLTEYVGAHRDTSCFFVMKDKEESVQRVIQDAVLKVVVVSKVEGGSGGENVYAIGFDHPRSKS